MTITLWNVNIHAQCTSFNGSTGIDLTGNQAFTGRMGMKFTVNTPISVTRLGAFDSGQDGFNDTITVGIINSAGTVVVPSSGTPITLSGVIGTYNGPFSMIGGFPPVTLAPGDYTVLAYGYGATEMNGNSNFGNLATVNTGGGLITHTDSPWDGTAAMGTPGSSHAIGGFHAGNFSFQAAQPVLQTTLNGTIITTDNNNVDNTASVVICNDNVVNVTLGTFTDLAGSAASDFKFKAYMDYTSTNVTFTGVIPANWSFPIARRLSDFPGYQATLSKIDPSLPASATIRWRIFVDNNLDGQIDPGECPGDWAVYTINFETTPPIITCPASITIDLPPTVCSSVATWSAATATDNCATLPTVVQLSEPASGSDFPIGITPITYQATDGSGNTSTCTFNVIINDYVAPPLGCKPIQLSLDDDCEGEITPTMVLTGWEGPGGSVLLGCEDLYTINVVGPNGENLGNTMGLAQLGKTLTYTITHPNGFICWDTVSIEDKIAPTITCRDAEVNCLTNISKAALPVVDDNCSAKAVLVNEVHMAFTCDPAYIGKVTKTWIAEDNAGNKSAPCTQTIYLLRSSVAGITPPPTNVILRCSDVYKRDDKGFGYPSPDTTGVPQLGSIKLYPLSQLNMVYCNSIIDYTDVLIVDTKCKKKIMRTWAITEWWCSTAVQKFLSIQIIDIIDDIAPVIPQLPHITVTTQTRSCSASVDLPKLTITDNCNVVYKVFINATLAGIPSGYVDGNGGKMELGVGTHTIEYTAIDECGNTRKMSYRITVRDNTDPVAICDQFTTVSIKTNGYTEVTASAVDDGSFDECGAVTLKVRRMEDPCAFGADTAWYDKVGFCCLDANQTRMVQLLVTDAGGNTNICMVSVNVQEKVNPTISCPADRTINDCLFTFDPSLSGSNAAFGAAVITDNCPANNTLVPNLDDQRNQCGIGLVVRTFTVTSGPIAHGTCTQTITFVNSDPFYINRDNALDPDDDIDWPKDYIATGQCTFEGLLPETLPDSSRAPKITEDACDLVGTKYSDKVFQFTTDGACYKIIRTWTVIDWCQKDDAGKNLIWTYEQEIKVMDKNPPVITSTTVLRLALTYDGACKDGDVDLIATATDCTPAADLKWSYTITRGGLVYKTGSGNNATGTYPIGIYNIVFTVEDKCGNASTTSYNFEIRNAKAPTAVCKQGLASTLVLMDTDGNGIGDTPMTILKPGFFDNKSGHVCGYPVQLSFSDDSDDTLAIFRCADKGKRPIELWVTDSNGNTSVCKTFVDIQDTNIPKLCPANLVSNVSGKTVKENNEEIQNVSVEIKGSEINPTLTDFSGGYAFGSVPTDANYQVIPSKDGDDMNGVSTLDIVMIQRHILGIDKLSTPYKLIAADVNGSGRITAADLTDLRKLVLGISPSLPDNTSWRFVDAMYKFPDPNDPWMTPFPELYNIENLSGNMSIDFTGIKIGDINGNAKGKNGINETQSRSKMGYTMFDTHLKKGDIVELPVYAGEAHTLYGIQVNIVGSDMIIREIKEGKLAIKSQDYVIPSVGSVSMSHVSANGTHLSKGDVLFVIEAEILKSGKLSEKLSLNRAMSPEVYVNSDMETKTIGLDFRSNTNGSFELIGNSPNPWNTNTSISFVLPRDGNVTFKVKDYNGRNVITEIKQQNAGMNVINLQKSDLGHSGVYIYELRFEDKVIRGKMILIE
ncbi:MAG: HYR domain-containing protein [Saprospiraceae bacterium]|nr:HYR domain-containing protein [Saprospiraceae bacterium]